MYKAMIIDDDEDYRNLLVRKLSRTFPGITITEIDPLTMDMPDAEYSWDNIDFIILDYQLGTGETGLDWFKLFDSNQMPATILLTARGSEEIAVRAIRLGIDEYIVKENFSNETLSDSITECIYNKKLVRAKFKDLSHKSIVFNKSNFIHTLGKIVTNKEMRYHLLVLNPLSYKKIGEEIGLSLQDNYIHHVANMIYQYLVSKKIECNIFIYREEYVAVIIQAKSYKRHLKHIYTMLDENSFAIGSIRYPSAVSIGVISPGGLEEKQLNKNDFEILSIAKILCKSAKTGNTNRISIYGDINLSEFSSSGNELSQAQNSDSIDIEKIISEGRISANYQPWIYIASDNTVSLRDICDVRIEIVNLDGEMMTHQELVQIMNDPFVKRIVDHWVLRHSVTQLKELALASGKRGNIKLAIKISLSTLADPAFIPWLHDLISDAEIPKNCLMFDFDVSQFLRNPEEYKKLIDEFGKSYQIKFIISGIDQIDTYYKLREVQPFNMVKLNVKDLVYGFPRNPVIKLINTMKEDGAKVVAVKVDDAEMLNLATGFDIDYVQGYLVGKPQVDMLTDSDGDIYAVI
jgi:EAL domain-containing protein (putative c-di-GMP-specific phosphodiesterase class I)/DNA-binding response OmpR family regulator